jgi:hypothetical protein
MNAQSPELEESQQSQAPYSKADDANIAVEPALSNNRSSSHLTVFDKKGMNQLSTNPDQEDDEVFDYEKALQDIYAEYIHFL